MGAEQEIKQTQVEWAKRTHRPLHESPKYECSHLRTVKANLFREGMSARACDCFKKGAGSELLDSKSGEPAKMKALHSSSALVINVFDYWTDAGSKNPLLKALGIDADAAARPLEFEKQFRTPLGGTPPHVDIAITLDSAHVIAIESKFTEWTGSKNSNWEPYFRESNQLWRNHCLPECQELAEDLYCGRAKFEFLGAEQLLKHALGLATQLGKGNFSLYYLYYDRPEAKANEKDRQTESDAHKDEIKCFADRIGEELRFKTFRYQDVYACLYDSLRGNPEHEEYLAYLGERYFPEIWAEAAS